MAARREIVVIRWDCGRHLHKSEDIAIRCEKRHEVAQARLKEIVPSGNLVALRKRRLRLFEAASLRDEGLSYKKIGERFGVCYERANSLVWYGRDAMDTYFRDLNYAAEEMQRRGHNA